MFGEFGLTSPSVIALRGGDLVNAWQVRTEVVAPETAQEIVTALGEVAPLRPGTTQVTSVSPTVGDEVTRAAIIAVIFSALVVLIYIMFVFRQVPNTFRYGTTAVIALVHDLLLVLGFGAITGVLLGWEVDALFLTAVLTVGRLLAARHHRPVRPDAREHRPAAVREDRPHRQPLPSLRPSIARWSRS